MKNTQLYLAIGIPSFLVIFSLLTNMVQINRLSDKMDRSYGTLSNKMDRNYETLTDKMDRNYETLTDKMDRNYETLSAKMDRNYEKLSDRIDRLAEQQHKDSLALQGYMIPLHDRMAVIEAKQK